jgi:membrane protein implicated in regulation of membrane protease activity
VTTFFLASAAIGFGLLVVGLVFDDFLEFMDGDGGPLSAPVIGAFLGAFGIGGFVGASATDNLWIALIAAGAAGLGLGWIALRMSIAVIGMQTDATPTSGDFQGQLGRVITPISRGGGEVMIRMGGSPVKLSARSDTDIDRGAEIVVIEVLSASAVRVMQTNQLFEQENP